MIFIVVGLPQGVATRPAGATGLSARTEDLFARGGRESAKNKFGGTKPISNNPFPILRIHPMSSANTRRIKGRWRGDSTEFDSRVEICRKVSKSVAFRRVGGGSVRGDRSAGYSFPIQWDSELLPARSRGADRPLGATNRVSCRNAGRETAAAGGGERRNVMKSDELVSVAAGARCDLAGEAAVEKREIGGGEEDAGHEPPQADAQAEF